MRSLTVLCSDTCRIGYLVWGRSLRPRLFVYFHGLDILPSSLLVADRLFGGVKRYSVRVYLGSMKSSLFTTTLITAFLFTACSADTRDEPVEGKPQAESEVVAPLPTETAAER